MNQGYRKTEDWKRGGKDFLVVVNHHTSATPAEFACGEGPHRWCVYAYIYPSHPHFEAFDGTEAMWQDAATVLPMHGGPSLLRVHTKHPDHAITSYQVGADYNHLHDDEYTHMANEIEAASVFRDADELFDWLSAKAQEVAAQ